MLLWTDPTEVLDRTLEDEIEAQIATAANREELRNAANAARWRRERDAELSSESRPTDWAAEKAIAWTILGVCALYFCGQAFVAVWQWTR